MSDKRQIIIQPSVVLEAENIYKYIKTNSPQNAEKFKQELLKSIDNVERNPEIYAPEKELNSKRILYRFILVMKSWKLVYKVTRNLLVFVGIVHTSRHVSVIKTLRTGDNDS